MFINLYKILCNLLSFEPQVKITFLIKEIEKLNTNTAFHLLVSFSSIYWSFHFYPFVFLPILVLIERSNLLNILCYVCISSFS